VVLRGLLYLLEDYYVFLLSYPDLRPCRPILISTVAGSLEEAYPVYAFTGGKEQAELMADTRHFTWEWIIMTSPSPEAVIGIFTLLSIREFNCKQKSI